MDRADLSDSDTDMDFSRPLPCRNLSSGQLRPCRKVSTWNPPSRKSSGLDASGRKLSNSLRRVSTCAADIRRIFDIYDSDGDGLLDACVVEQVLQLFYIQPGRDEVLNAANSCGQVCVEAFINLFAVRMTAQLRRDVTHALRERDLDENYTLDLGDYASDKIRKIFRVFDKDGDGFISLAELRHVTGMVGERLSTEDLEAMLREADIDGDGRISFQEFGLMLLRLNHGR